MKKTTKITQATPAARKVVRLLEASINESEIATGESITDNTGATGLNLNMDPTKKDSAIMAKIAARSMAQMKELGVKPKYDGLDLHMDLCAVHLNGCPLRLADFLAADDLNFAHDISGIRLNLDRHTGELKNHFHPRFAVRKG